MATSEHYQENLEFIHAANHFLNDYQMYRNNPKKGLEIAIKRNLSLQNVLLTNKNTLEANKLFDNERIDIAHSIMKLDDKIFFFETLAQTNVKQIDDNNARALTRTPLLAIEENNIPQMATEENYIPHSKQMKMTLHSRNAYNDETTIQDISPLNISNDCEEKDYLDALQNHKTNKIALPGSEEQHNKTHLTEDIFEEDIDHDEVKSIRSGQIIKHKSGLQPMELAFICDTLMKEQKPLKGPEMFVESSFFNEEKINSALAGRSKHFSKNIKKTPIVKKEKKILNQAPFVKFYTEAAKTIHVNPETKSFEEFIGDRILNDNPTIMPLKSKEIRMRGRMLKKARFIDNFSRFPSDLEIDQILLQYVSVDKKICLKTGFCHVNVRKINGEIYLECDRYNGEKDRIGQLHLKNILFMGPADVMRRLEVVVNKKARQMKLAMWPELGCTNNYSQVMGAYNGYTIVYAAPVTNVSEDEWLQNNEIDTAPPNPLLNMAVSEYHRNNLKFVTPIDCLKECLLFSLTGNQQNHRKSHITNSPFETRTLLSLKGNKAQDPTEFLFNSIIDYKNFHKCDIIAACNLSKFLLNEIGIFTTLHLYIGASIIKHVNGYNMKIEIGKKYSLEKNNILEASRANNQKVISYERILSYMQKHNYITVNISLYLKPGVEMWKK